MSPMSIKRKLSWSQSKGFLNEYHGEGESEVRGEADGRSRDIYARGNILTPIFVQLLLSFIYPGGAQLLKY